MDFSNCSVRRQRRALRSKEMDLMQRTIRILLVTGAALVPPGLSGAEIQKVSAQECTPDGCTSSGCTSEGCNSCRGARSSRRQERRACRGDYCDPGSGRPCNFRSSSRDFVLDWAGNCGPIGKAARRRVPGAARLQWCCRTKAYPDSGWAPPAHTPINRTGNTYQQYWSHAWYGNPGAGYGAGAPMVYQPTDTTHLGYGYANVPTWRSNPRKIPPVPNPSNFHARFCPRDPRCGACSGGCNTGCLHGGYGYTTGDCMNGQCQGTVMMINPGGMAEPPGFVRVMQQHRASQQIRPVGLPVRAVQQPAPKQTQKIQPVSNAAPKKETQTKKVQQSVVQKPSKNNSSTAARRPTSRRTAGRRSQPRRSGGWFGLPSLSEMKF